MARGSGKVQATTTFVTWHEDVEVEVRKGDELDASHPIVEGHREFFKPASVKRAPKAKA